MQDKCFTAKPHPKSQKLRILDCYLTVMEICSGIGRKAATKQGRKDLEKRSLNMTKRPNAFRAVTEVTEWQVHRRGELNDYQNRKK